MKENEEVFEDIYVNRKWGFGPRSGGGSSLNQTRVLAERLPELVYSLDLEKILDCGCGDWTWMKNVDLKGAKYTGLDVSPSAIADLQAKFPDRKFKVADICRDKLPKADLALCRDVLVHLPFDNIWDFISNLKSSKIRYLATTAFPSRTLNRDCETGDWRPINYEIAPFNFPLPFLTINERLEAHGGHYRDKSTCIWHVDSLPSRPLTFET
jgi:hypothetical protein